MRRRRLYGKKKTNKLHYKDLTCEHPQSALPMSYTSEAPFYYYDASDDERQNDFELYSEICIMNQRHTKTIDYLLKNQDSPRLSWFLPLWHALCSVVFRRPVAVYFIVCNFHALRCGHVNDIVISNIDRWNK